VLDAVDAMKRSDLPCLGASFYSSHASQRDDFEVSVPEIDLLVDLAKSDSAVFGARLTGGGFGGSVVLLVQSDQADRVARRVAAEYASESGHSPSILVPQIS
jgi:galactokinase